MLVRVQVEFLTEQVGHHRRHQRPGEQVRRHHREDNSHGERREQVARGSGEQQHRHEHDADGERCDERGDGDLRCAIQHRPDQRLPHRQVAVGVFDLNRRVIDQDADRERQTAKRHHVDGLAEQAEHRK